MKKRLDHYVGRIVRLNKLAFQAIKKRALQQGIVVENCFVVAEVNQKIKKMICYGTRFRVVVGFSDVILI